VPFDIREQRYWTYGKREELDSLAQRLEDAIQQTLAVSERRDRRRQRSERPPATCIETVVAFVGQTERGPERPELITSAAAFVEAFGAWLSPDVTYLAHAVKGFFASGGVRAYVARVVSRRATIACANVSSGIETALAGETLVIHAATRGSWGNRITVDVRPGTRRGWRLSLIYEGAEPGGERQMEDYDNCSLDSAGPNPLLARVNDGSRLVRLSGLGFAAERGLHVGRVSLAGGSDGPPPGASDYEGTDSDPDAETTALAAIAALDDVDLLCVPDHVHPSLPRDEQRQLTDAIVAACERTRDRFALLATLSGVHDTDLLKPSHDTRFAATYYPWLRTPDGAVVPPVGHVAGVFARNDRERGVHFAPLGLALEGVATPALDIEVSAEARDTLERLSVNVLAADSAFGQPTPVTAYTLAIEEKERYINVSRLASFTLRALQRGLSWVSFERSEPPVWRRIETEVRCFLMRLWEDGVLAGDRPEHAFFVRCDETTMTRNDVDNGRIVMLVSLSTKEPVPFLLDLPTLHTRPMHAPASE
jgi:hypothetical protein